MSDISDNLSRGQLFWDWWKAHLAELLPAAWRTPSDRQRRPARASVAAERYWAPGVNGADAGKPLTAAPSSGKVALLLSDDNGLRRRVTLPLSVHRSTRAVLTHEIDRLTPLRASDLYFDTVVTARDWAAGTCSVELIAAPRDRVRQQIEALESRGLTVDRVVLNNDDLATSVNLLPPERQQADAASGRGPWLTYALGALCLALAIALAAFPVWQARERVIVAQAAEAQAKIDAEQTSILHRQVEKQLGEYNFLLQRKHATPLVVQLLDDLTRRLPDDTWVQTMEIKHNVTNKTRDITMQGETGSGGKLMQMLQESPLLKEPAPKAAMTRVAPNAERFHVGAEVMAAQLPERMLPVDATGAVTVPIAPAAPAGAPTSARTPTADAKTAAPVPGAAAPAAATVAGGGKP